MASTTRSRATSLLALLGVVFLLATACSDDSGDDASTETTAAASEDGATTTTAPPDAEPPSESDAASLRSDLVGLLGEQVFLTGMTVNVGVNGEGSDAALPSAYEDAALEGADDLANVIGGAYGSGPGNDFVAAWNDHRQAIVAYGLDGGPEGAVEATREAVLDALAAADPEADLTGVADGMAVADTALLSAVDQLTGGQVGAADDLQAAAADMSGVGFDLAGIIAEHSGTEGEVDSPEAALRADLSSLLQESAMLTALDLMEIVEAGGAASGSQTRATIDESTEALAGTILPDSTAAAQEFADLWSGHIDDFEQYTTALVNDDAQGIEDAQDAIVAFRDDIGEVLSEEYEGFTTELVAEELVDHTDTILAYADALVREAGDLAGGVEETSQVTDAPTEAPDLLREAALAARVAGRSLALGITAPLVSNPPPEPVTTTTAA
jgi:hypothetical protein